MSSVTVMMKIHPTDSVSLCSRHQYDCRTTSPRRPCGPDHNGQSLFNIQTKILSVLLKVLHSRALEVSFIQSPYPPDSFPNHEVCEVCGLDPPHVRPTTVAEGRRIEASPLIRLYIFCVLSVCVVVLRLPPPADGRVR